MEIGDLIILVNSPFHEKNIFGYANGDLGVIKEVFYTDGNMFETCLVLLLKDFKEYHIPNSYMQKLENKC